MRQLLDSDLEIYVDSGFIYLPLLFDPTIEREIKTRQLSESSTEYIDPIEPRTIIQLKDRYFVKTLSLNSLLANFEKINPDAYQHLRDTFLRNHYLTPALDGIGINGKLRMIITKIMPYFIKTNKGLKRKNLDETELLDLLEEKINVPAKYYEAAKALIDVTPLRNMLKALENEESFMAPIKTGLLPSGELRNWCQRALRVNIAEKEQKRLKQILQMRERLSRTKQNHIAVLLYITEKGFLEIDGFGFMRADGSDNYLVYKRTGEYILKDYYARSYRFPDCRVAVSTSTSLKPIVIDTYKHPFLNRQEGGQEICVRHFNPPTQFTADNVIRCLEEGITALLYGYDARRRNGYHSLDRTRLHVRTVEFDDYRI